VKLARLRLLSIACVTLAPLLIVATSSAATKAHAHPHAGSSSGDAPASLVIGKVLSPALLTSAGLSSSPVEDDGGASAEGAFTTQASLATTAGHLSLDLSSFPNVGEAKEAYQNLTSAPAGGAGEITEPLAGSGFVATTVGLDTYLRKGSQVLSIVGELSSAANSSLAQQKEQGTLGQSSIDAANASVQKVTQALATGLAAKISGNPVVNAASLTYFPPGSVNPCGVKASSLNNGDIHVSSQPVVSDTPPALECVYTFIGKSQGEPGTGQLAVYTLTDVQAAAAASPFTLKSAFAQTGPGGGGGSGNGGGGGGASGDSGSSGGGATNAVSSATDGPISANGTTSGEPDYTILDDLPKDGDVSKLLITLDDVASTYVVDRHHCTLEIAQMADDLIDEQAGHHVSAVSPAGQAIVQKIGDDIAAWCKQEAGGGDQ
jgi:hypothetical protein